jgi:hypothetical protein
MKMLEALTGLGKLATVVSGAVPGVGAIVTGIEAISAIVETFEGSEEEKDAKRTELYFELGADLAELSASIMRGLKDGKITAEEQAKIIKELKDLIPGRD